MVISKVDDSHVWPTSLAVTSSARYGKYLMEKLWSFSLALALSHIVLSGPSYYVYIGKI